MATKNKQKQKAVAPVATEKTTAVAKAEAADLAKTNTILEMVNQDINKAEIGKFFALRAGVGLLVVKGMCPHGEWGGMILQAMPGRAPRTIREYMTDAKKFLEAKGIVAGDIWQELSEFDPATMLTQGDGGALLLASGEEENEMPPEAAVNMAAYLNAQNAEKSKSNKEAAKNRPVPAKLTKAQKKEAAAADLALAIGKVAVALNGEWTMCDTETLETVQASLTVAAATIKEELKKRG